MLTCRKERFATALELVGELLFGMFKVGFCRALYSYSENVYFHKIPISMHLIDKSLCRFQLLLFFVCGKNDEIWELLLVSTA